MNQIFPIAPASVRPIWFLLPIAILVIVVGSAGEMMAASVRGARTSTFELSNEGLRLHGDMYGRLVSANGEKALLYVTDPKRVVRVPTTAGYSLLLSVAETDDFVEQLRAMGGRAGAMPLGSPR